MTTTLATQPGDRTIGWVVRRILLYVGLAIGALTVFALVLALAIRFGVADKLTGPWMGFVAYTVLLFWVTIWQSKRIWRYPGFWFAVTGLVVVHFVVFAAILRAFPDWRVIWFWPVVVFEGGIFDVFLTWLFRGRRAKLSG